MPTEHITRRQREHLQHRSEILETALDLFARDGFHNVTMQAIAEASEFSVGTLYNFFRNKDDLYRALLSEKVAQFHAALQNVLEAPGSETERLRSWLTVKIRLFRKNIAFVRLYYSETMGASFNAKAGLNREMLAKYEDILAQLEQLFAGGVKRKVFKNLDTRYLALALEGISNTILFDHLEKFEDREINADVILSLLFETVLIKKV
jgi:AcrR family transcriptional regulator